MNQSATRKPISMKRDSDVSGPCQQGAKNGPRFAIIPGRAPYDAKLTDFDCRILACIGRHTNQEGWCNLNQGKMAEKLGKARESVNRSVRKLVKEGYLEKVDLRSSTHGTDRQNILLYRVLMDAIPAHEAVKANLSDGEEDLVIVASQGGVVTPGSQGVVTPGSQGLCAQDHNTTFPSLTFPIINEKQYPSLRSGERAHEIEAKFDEIEGKGKAVAVVEVETAKAIRLPGKPERPRASRLPDDWTLPEEWRDWAVKEEKLPLEVAIREGHKFGDYWKAKAGKDAVKANWLATWRNWARRALEMAPRGTVNGKGAIAQQAEGAKRFPDNSNYTQIFDVWIRGEDLNDILDDVEGSTYAQVRKALKLSEERGRSAYHSGWNEKPDYKPSKSQILDYAKRSVAQMAAIAKHGTVEKLCGGKIARLDTKEKHRGTLSSDIAAISDEFMGRMEELYPLATSEGGYWEDVDKDQWRERRSAQTGHDVIAGIWSDVISATKGQNFDCGTGRYSCLWDWANYGPETQKKVEAAFEGKIRKIEELAREIVRKNAEKKAASANGYDHHAAA